MSKSSELDRTAKLYILDCIDNSGFNDDTLNTQEKIDFLKETFYSEYKWRIDQMGEQKAMAVYISGLPSSFNIAYSNDDILKLAVKWGSIPEDYTENQAYKIIENWFNFVAAKTCQLFKGFRIPK